MKFKMIRDSSYFTIITVFILLLPSYARTKLRFSLEREQQGKSGAYRIIYLDIQLSSHTVLLLIYAKNQQADLKPNQKKVLKQLVEQLKSLYSSERVNEND